MRRESRRRRCRRRFQQDDLVAQVDGSVDRGAYADVGFTAGHNQRSDALALKLAVQPSVHPGLVCRFVEDARGRNETTQFGQEVDKLRVQVLARHHPPHRVKIVLSA